MKNVGIRNPESSLEDYGIINFKTAFWNLTPEELTEHSIKKDLGVLSDTGALVVYTGKFTGRSPKDRFIVEDDITRDAVDWNHINMPLSSENFDKLHKKVLNSLRGKEVYIKDAAVAADPKYRMNVRLVAELPWLAQFANNMFLRLSKEEIVDYEPEWTVISAPGCMGDPKTDGIRQGNFAVINFTKKMIIIGGTGYTGEVKKGIFSVLNFILPHEKGVLPMHCSANIRDDGDTAIFFGLSGTGKTTLSASPYRKLIGDDEHGWSDNGIFNFEGGCYAKCIGLSPEKEPEIFAAIKHGAILENINFFEGTRTPDYANSEITQNTRVSYPIYHIDNAVEPSVGRHPRNIFFLTADAFGVLPPISKLTPGQAMYYFISGYTAKVAGTEEGIVEPEATFSACFGAPFMPLHPTKYADMLGSLMQEHNTHVWLVNTGWTGGAYGDGSRIKLKYTRAMVRAALRGELDTVDYKKHDIFGLFFPTSCPDVPAELLCPGETWSSKNAYMEKANLLAKSFVKNFEQYADAASLEMLAAQLRIIEHH